jgi:hypothetical protein
MWEFIGCTNWFYTVPCFEVALLYIVGVLFVVGLLYIVVLLYIVALLYIFEQWTDQISHEVKEYECVELLRTQRIMQPSLVLHNY